MIFDCTDLGTGLNVRHKPSNHTRVEGWIFHGNDLVASLRTLALVYGQDDDLAGGRFTLAWHKLRGPITHCLTLVTYISDDRLGCMSSEARSRMYQVVHDVQILFEGSPLAIGNFGELLGQDVAFFGRRSCIEAFEAGARHGA